MPLFLQILPSNVTNRTTHTFPNNQIAHQAKTTRKGGILDRGLLRTVAGKGRRSAGQQRVADHNGHGKKLVENICAATVGRREAPAGVIGED